MVQRQHLLGSGARVDGLAQGGRARVEVNQLGARVAEPRAVPLEGVGGVGQVANGAQYLHTGGEGAALA